MKKYGYWLLLFSQPILVGIGFLIFLQTVGYIAGKDMAQSGSTPMYLMNGLFSGLNVYVFESFWRRLPLCLSLGCTRRHGAWLLSCERLILSISSAGVTYLYVYLLSAPVGSSHFSLFMGLLFGYLLSANLTGLISTLTLRITGKSRRVLLSVLTVFLVTMAMVFGSLLFHAPDLLSALMKNRYFLPLEGLVCAALHVFVVFYMQKKLAAYTVKV